MQAMESSVAWDPLQDDQRKRRWQKKPERSTSAYVAVVVDNVQPTEQNGSVRIRTPRN